MAMALAQPAMQLPITGASYGACVPNVSISNGALQPEPFPFFRAEAGSNAIVLCRYRSATAGNCLIGYFAASSFMGSAGAAREWNPGQIRFAGMAIDPSTHLPDAACPSGSAKAWALSGRCPGRPPLSPWLKSPLRFAPQAPARSRAPRTASRGRARPSCPTAARAEFTRRR